MGIFSLKPITPALSQNNMQFKLNSILSVVAVLFAGQAFGAVLIATDPVAACNPPNNGDHHGGSSCKFYSGPSDSSHVVSGICIDQGGTLTCVGQ
ncbi:hypothetical protein VNI00_010678 [Paramarasmius palmivorus]|uniref:Uncharacterized protein n=1 Tax=Paramarasmius palmivorus TaxID=297713 RepID=A0AAW0CJ71_9AGAR